MYKIKKRFSGTLSVSGEGEVKAKPDVATLRLGVVTTAKTAQEAIRENAQRMDEVIDAMKAIGVPSEDLQTTGISLSPVVDYDEKSPTYLKIVQYRVEDTLSIEVDVEKAGRVLDEAVEAGANVGGGLIFGLRDVSMFRDSALTAAVEAARHNAEVIAEALKGRLIGARSVDATYGGRPSLMRGTLEKAMEVQRTPIEPGELTVSATVRMTYEYELNGKS